MFAILMIVEEMRMFLVVYVLLEVVNAIALGLEVHCCSTLMLAPVIKPVSQVTLLEYQQY